MNVRPLIEAVQSLDTAVTATFDPAERNQIQQAAEEVRKILRKRGVFVGNMAPDTELRALADATLRDPFGDAAQAIVDELRREICERETPWHEDGTLCEIIETILREHHFTATTTTP